MMLNLLEGPVSGDVTERVEKEKSPAPGGIRTHDLSAIKTISWNSDPLRRFTIEGETNTTISYIQIIQAS